jgi:hypothetical protein
MEVASSSGIPLQGVGSSRKTMEVASSFDIPPQQ